jgi:hypothetical protein
MQPEIRINDNQYIEGHQLLLKVIIGSQAYGTSTETSDVDFKGIYMQNPMEILLGKHQKQIEVTKDEHYYEIGRFFELLKKNNPTILEMLNTPEDCIVYKHPLLNEIFDKRDSFITKLCKDSVGGYAVEQIRKAQGLGKKMNMKKEEIQRKGVLDFCFISVPNFQGSRSIPQFCEDIGISQNQIGLTNLDRMPDCYQVYVDIDNHAWANGIVKENGNESNQVRLSNIPKGVESVGVMNYNDDGYQHHCRKYKEYVEWLEKRNEQRYVDFEGHGQAYDGKSILHTRRLIDMGIEIAQGKGVLVRRENAQELLKIRKGEVDYPSFIKQCEADIELMNKLFDESDLPDDIDQKSIDDILKVIRNYQLYKTL